VFVFLTEVKDGFADLDQAALVQFDGDLDGCVDELISGEVGRGGGDTPKGGGAEVSGEESVTVEASRGR
jgi:hypothetical protein